MTDPITPIAVAGPPPALAREAAAPSAPAPAASTPPAPTPDATERPHRPAAAATPITWDATREGDIFVYTLRDPATDTVLAVIPHEEVTTEGRTIDRRV
jgi:hypothetical protein